MRALLRRITILGSVHGVMLYGIAIIIALLLAVALDYAMEHSARLRHKRLLVAEQKVHATLAAQALQERVTRLEKVVELISAYSLPEYLGGKRSQDFLPRLFLAIVNGHPEVLAVHFENSQLGVTVSHVRRTKDVPDFERFAQLAPESVHLSAARMLPEGVHTGWVAFEEQGMLHAGLVLPVTTQAGYAGTLIVIVDLAAITEGYGNVFTLQGVPGVQPVLWHPANKANQQQARNAEQSDGVGRQHTDGPSDVATLDAGTSGIGTSVFWSEVQLGIYTLIVALPTPAPARDTPLTGLQRQRLVLFGALAVTILLISIIFYYSVVFKANRLSEARYRQLAHTAFDWEVWFGPDGGLLYVSPSCERISGYTAEAFMNDPQLMRQIIHKDDLAIWEMHLAAGETLSGEALEYRIFTAQGTLRYISFVGRNVFNAAGDHQGYRCSIRDVTERVLMERELQYQALHDPLTGVANRALCLDRIHQAMERNKRRDSRYYAVIFMDLDRFKMINDSYGHTVGDQLLVECAERLQCKLRSVDTLSRFGGDEFVVLLEELTAPRDAVWLVRRLRKALEEPFLVGGAEIRTSCSFGILLSPTDYQKPAELVHSANIAMYRAKEAGRNRFRVFHSRMLEQAVEAMTLEHDMRRALNKKEFFLEYQPIVSTDDGSLAGVEALVRWQHPERGRIGPAQFIPIAEESGMILELGLWVLDCACRDLALLQQQGAPAEGFYMSVNLSAKQFSEPALVGAVQDILRQHAVSPKHVKLEITESAIMDNAEAALSTLRRLKALGVCLSIDDFGTGYSSLSYLQRFPVDTLKIDRSFITNISDNPGNLEIVKAVIALARSLGLDAVAEGVEQQKQLLLLRDMQCPCVQGFLFHQPLPFADVKVLLGA